MISRLIFLIFSSLLLLACKEDIPEPPTKVFDNRDNKVGIYHVVNDTMDYYITIESKDSAGQWPSAFLIIKNVLNIFPELIEPVYYPEQATTGIGIYPNSPVFDKFGKRWGIFLKPHPDGDKEYNRIRNDSLRLYFQLTNIKYRIEDSVPYVNEYIAIEGVKIK